MYLFVSFDSGYNNSILSELEPSLKRSLHVRTGKCMDFSNFEKLWIKNESGDGGSKYNSGAKGSFFASACTENHNIHQNHKNRPNTQLLIREAFKDYLADFVR